MPSMLFLCCQVLVGWRPLGGSERLTRHSRAQFEPPDRPTGLRAETSPGPQI